MQNRKIILIAGLLVLFCFNVHAQQSADSAVFRFIARSDMFLLRGNQTALERLHEFTDRHRAEIASGKIPVYVDGYCPDLQTARTRSNRVKSELIINKGLKEEHFITRNHAESYRDENDVVVVSFVFKETAVAGVATVPDVPKVPETPVEKPVEQKPAEKPAVVEHPAPTRPAGEGERAPEQSQEVEQTHASLSFGWGWGEVNIRTNLLYWLATIPNIGVEYKPSENIGILLNGGWNHWVWTDESRHFRLWYAQPEVRYYFSSPSGRSGGVFLGIEGHAGEFNLKFSDEGNQGGFYGGGLTGGYRIRLSRLFDMDFSLGLGYTHLKYESYTRSNGAFVLKEGGLKKNFWGPTQAGVSLIWKIK